MLSGCLVVALALVAAPNEPAAQPTLKVGAFSVDASPKIGSPMAYDRTKGVVQPLRCTGIVLVGDDRPIVLVAIDWIGVANDADRDFRQAIAQAVGTAVDRVEIHALHQHDAPEMDFSTSAILDKHGITDEFFDVPFARDLIARTAQAARKAADDAQPVTHLGLGAGIVEKVASTRRILNAEGTKVEHVRYSSCDDPKIRDKPEGVIDPSLKMISFWNGETPVAILTFYATHPQSYYRTGLANPDFPGIARDQRQQATGHVHIHFDGAGGNVAAGKYNDGSHENRQILADRVRAGMDRAWANTVKTPIAAGDVGWKAVPVKLPVDPELNEAALAAIVDDDKAPIRNRGNAARELAWVRHAQAGDPLQVASLRIGRARVLFLPGELFVEYQLAAQKLRPDLFVAMAAYGDCGPGYVGVESAYPQGGYETSHHVSLVAPSVEHVLMKAINELLKD